MTPRTILITGGTGKLGRSLVGHFLSTGDTVVITARSDESLARVVSEYGGSGKNLMGMKVDLTAPGSIPALCNQLDAQGIFPDCVINNARSVAYLKVEENGCVSRENFSNELLLDVIVPYELTMAVARQVGSRLTRVVNIGSQYGTVAANRHLYTDPDRQSPLHYGVAKAALAHLTRELAVRLADKGIRVNCIAFGGVEGRVDAAFKERYAKLCPMGRMLRDDEVAGPVDMLLSDSCSGITGHVLAVDGGWTIW